jgi:hypothetical protein
VGLGATQQAREGIMSSKKRRIGEQLFRQLDNGSESSMNRDLSDTLAFVKVVELGSFTRPLRHCACPRQR